MAEKIIKRRNQHVQRPVGFANDYEKAEEATKLPQTVVEAELIRGDGTNKAKRFRKQGGAGHIIRKPHLDQILRSGYATAALELERLSKKAYEKAAEGGLDADEVRRYLMLVDAVAKLGKTEKDHFPDEDENLTPEELIKRAEEAATFLREQKKG